MDQNLCGVCHLQLQTDWYFCPNCGKKIKETPPSLSFISQVGIYALSFFLPPLGLFPAIKYLRQKEQAAKTIGIIALVLTLVSLLISVILAMRLGNYINDEINRTMRYYQGFGL